MQVRRVGRQIINPTEIARLEDLLPIENNVKENFENKAFTTLFSFKTSKFSTEDSVISPNQANKGREREQELLVIIKINSEITAVKIKLQELWLRWEKSKHMTNDHGDKKNIFPLAVCQVGRLLMENTLELIYKADILNEGYQN